MSSQVLSFTWFFTQPSNNFSQNWRAAWNRGRVGQHCHTAWNGLTLLLPRHILKHTQSVSFWLWCRWKHLWVVSFKRCYINPCMSEWMKKWTCRSKVIYRPSVQEVQTPERKHTIQYRAYVDWLNRPRLKGWSWSGNVASCLIAKMHSVKNTCLWRIIGLPQYLA